MVNHAIDPSFEGRRRPPVVHESRSKYTNITEEDRLGGGLKTKNKEANMGDAITM
jgi:hypothetical protein